MQPKAPATPSPIPIRSCSKTNNSPVAAAGNNRAQLRVGDQYDGELRQNETIRFAFDAPLAQVALVQLSPKHDIQASVQIIDPQKKLVQETVLWYTPVGNQVETIPLVPLYGGVHELRITGIIAGAFELRLDNAETLARILPGDSCKGYVSPYQYRYYSLPVTEGQSVVVDIEPQAGFDPAIQIYDEHWRHLATRNSVGGGLPEHAVIAPDYNGYAILEISGHGGSQGEYTAMRK